MTTICFSNVTDSSRSNSVKLNTAIQLTLKRILVWRLRVEVGVTYSWTYWQSSCHQCKVRIEFRNSACPSQSSCNSDFSTKMLHVSFLASILTSSCSLFPCPLLLYPPSLKKSLSKCVVFLEMLIRLFGERASSSGACPRWLPLSSFPLTSPSLIDYFLVVFLSPISSTLPASLVTTLFPVTHFLFFLCYAGVR